MELSIIAPEQHPRAVLTGRQRSETPPNQSRKNVKNRDQPGIGFATKVFLLSLKMVVYYIFFNILFLEPL